MMFIPNKNETIYQCVYTSLVGSEKKIKQLMEFGFYRYKILPENDSEGK